MRGVTWPRCALLLMGLLCVGRAHAQPVALDLTGCGELPHDEVRRLLALELRGRLLPAGDALPSDAHEVSVGCEAGRAVITLREDGVHREIGLDSVPETLRARLLALAIAELTPPHGGIEPDRAPEEEPPLVARPAESEPRPRSSVSHPAEANTRVRSSRLADMHVGAGLQVQAAPLFGLAGALTMLARVRASWVISAMLDGGHARVPIDQGTLRVRSASLRLGPALTLARPTFTLHGGVGARLTLLELSGEPMSASVAEARSFFTWLLGPSTYFGVSRSFGAHLFVGLEVELAHHLRPVRAEVRGGEGRTLTAVRAASTLHMGFAW